MSDEINDGGPAFPTALIRGSSPGRETGGDTGMTLRDYFAAKAMQAMIGNLQCINRGVGDNPRDGYQLDFVEPEWSDLEEKRLEVVKAAYFIADAMLVAREKLK